jgi:putative membrane protein
MNVAFTHWSASWPVLAGYVLAVAAQLAVLLSGGSAPAPLTPARRAALSRETAAFHLGLLIVVLALVSPLGYWSGVYLWVRALQMLLVTLAGPGLLVLGAPRQAFRQLRPAADAGPAGQVRPVPVLASRPLAAVVIFNAAWLCWQVPALLDLARTNSAVALAEHASLLAAGLLFWRQLIAAGDGRLPSPPLRRIALLTGTGGVFTVAGMALVFGSGVVYPGYANAAHHIMTVLDDQQLSGAVLWMGSLPPLMIAGTALVLQWLSNEESEELSAGLDRVLAPRQHGWPSRPVIR